MLRAIEPSLPSHRKHEESQIDSLRDTLVVMAMRKREALIALTIVTTCEAFLACGADAHTPTNQPQGGSNAGAVAPPATHPITYITVPAPPPDLHARTADANAIETLVRYNVERINALRGTKNIAPLLHDTTISAFAREGSAQLARDHSPHAHFVANTKRPPAGFNHRMAENQGDPNGVFVMDQDAVANGKKQIDVMMKIMFDEGPGGGHYDNLMSGAFKRVGIGLVYVNERLYMTNDFSD